MAKKSKSVYFFGRGRAEGKGDMRALLGGKGANLADMTHIRIPVPAGFTISTEVCTYYYTNRKTYPKSLAAEVKDGLAKVEKAMGKKFGDPNNPLLVSVRSGSRASMPGMMDTILNLGLNDTTVQGLISASGNERFAWDSYRRFVQMYGDVVMGVQAEGKDAHEPFEEVIAAKKTARGVKNDAELAASDLRELVHEFKALIRHRVGKEFPADPMEQLWGAVGAVFGSWMTPRAVRYRQLERIPDDWGTAVNVQAMVFGNMGENCATGVAFTRDPSNGKKIFYGEFLINAQGEDVVAGIRTPQPLAKEQARGTGMKSLEEAMPKAFAQLSRIRATLEKHYRDMQDIEFTIENGTLYMLQTRNGKRTAGAAVKIAVDMVKEKLISRETAVGRVKPEQLDQLLHPQFDPKATRDVIAIGLPASPGAAVGRIVFNADDAEAWAAKGEKVILVRIETSPEDIGGMVAASGILTARGGMTSHAAVVARGMGKCCVAGCGSIAIDYHGRVFAVEGRRFAEGDWISLNGSTGEVMAGQLATVQAGLSGDFETLMKWADSMRILKVRANADTPNDAAVARKFGAEGIGLCRTEHMFFEGERIDAVREMILAETEEGRRKALEKILPMQRQDFIGIFEAMKGLPVTVRLLDPPLHEFVPHEWEQMVELGEKLGVPPEKIKNRVAALKEFNPMLGHRGCRLGITYPEIYEIQVRAIIEAVCDLKRRRIKVLPEIMHPLVGTVREFEVLEDMTRRVAAEVMKEKGIKVGYLVGTMIEVPRAALIADKIAQRAEFFSFGTNDLTQLTYGYSRDDSGPFITHYLERKILPRDPFQTLDAEGVGQLVTLGTERGRKARKNLKVGICGEHGGDPDSIATCQAAGLNYVSCSPYRVPIARLAAAQAALSSKKRR